MPVTFYRKSLVVSSNPINPMRSLRLTVLFLTALAGTSFAKEGRPEQQIDAMFKQLSSEKKATAFQDFFAGTRLASQKPAEIKVLDAQASAAWTFYGSPVSYEILERRQIGESLFRVRWLTKNKEEIPLFWNALFYLRAGKWDPLNIVFFDSPEKAGI
jgi:hypothetical protein